MTIFEHELRKYDTWIEELEIKRKDEGENSSEFKAREAKFQVLLRKQEQLFRGKFFEQMYLDLLCLKCLRCKIFRYILLLIGLSVIGKLKF